MLQLRGKLVSCIVIGALALAGSALAGQAPSPAPLQAPPAVSSPAPAPAAPGLAFALAGQPQPVFLSTLSECRASCYNDFRACQAAHNPYSFCLQLYNGCYCSCNDSCYP